MASFDLVNFLRDVQTVELKWIQKFQGLLKSSFMDWFFIAWSYVDTFTSMMIIIAIAWFLINSRIGIQLLCIFLLSSVFNGLLKDFFSLSRPCQIDPTVGILNLCSPGFPSGAAQTAAIIAGVCLIETKKNAYRYLGILFGLLLCISRLYLGVHYFTDIVGGLLVGSCLVVLYWGFSFLTERQELSLFLLLSIVLLMAAPSKFVVQSGLLSGASLGLFIVNNREAYRKDWFFRSLEGVNALVGLFVFSALKDIYPTWKLLFTFAEGFWFSYAGRMFVQRFMMSWNWSQCASKK